MARFRLAAFQPGAMGELFVVLFRFLILAILYTLVRSIFRNIVKGFRSAAPPDPQRQPPSVQAGGELKKDPVCGVYVSPAVSLMRIVKGETYYFCSPECRDRYQAH